MANGIYPPQSILGRMSLPTGEIRIRVMLPASPEIVYDMLMDPVMHAEFTNSPASGSSEVGGIFIASDGYISARNLVLEKGKRIVQAWSTTEWPEGLHAKGQGTELSMVQTGVPRADVERYKEGWYDYYWKPLTTLLKRMSTKGQL
jgi:activator of HSP90 ATPase